VLLPFFSLLNEPAAAPQGVQVTLVPGATGAQIQRALDNLPADGEVVLPAGQYEISRPLLLRHDREALRGSGPDTILRLADDANCPVVVIGPALDNPKVTCTRLRLSNLLIDGNRRNQKTEHWRTADDGSEINNNGVHIWNSTGVTVDHVICCRCRSGGVVTAGVRRLRLNAYRAYDNQFDGLACYQTSESLFSALSLHDNVAAGISVDLDFHGNCISNAVLTANDLGIFMRDSRDNTFKGLTIAKCRHHGIFMAQATVPTAAGWQLAPNTQCTGNTFVNLVVRDCAGRAFQVNDASCSNNVISNATFLRNAQGGLYQPASHPVRLNEVATR
jgi:hypothetical protein